VLTRRICDQQRALRSLEIPLTPMKGARIGRAHAARSRQPDRKAAEDD